MLIYFLFIPIVLFCAIAATKRDRFGWLLVLVILFAFVAGFRAESVGIDTKNYINKLILISNGSPEFAYGLEPGFKILAKCLLKVNSSPTFFFVIAALLTNLLILRRLWDFRYIASVPCMVLCYYASFYGYTFNIMRQFLAISVIFYSSRLLEKRKYIQFAIIVLLCTFFLHQSSIICIGFIAADLFMWKDLSKWQRILNGTGLIMAPIGFSYIMSKLFIKYAGYFETLSSNVGFMVLAKIVFFIISIYISRYILIPKLSQEQIVSNYQEYRMRKATTIYYPIGLLLTVIGYFYPFMDRIGLYYMIYECVYFGMLTKTNLNNSVVSVKNYSLTTVRNNALIFLMMLLLIIGYNFCTDLLNNAQGIVPYISVLF